MARFRGTVKGNRTEASRLGHKADGLQVKANGWDAGVKVTVTDRDGEDVFLAEFTGGSNDNWPPVSLGLFKRGENGKVHRVNPETGEWHPWEGCIIYPPK